MDDIAIWLRARAAEETSNDTAAKFWGAADHFEALRSENARLGNLAKSLSAVVDAPDRAEAIIDIIADRDSWRDQCAMRDVDNARLAKELEEARKALKTAAESITSESDTAYCQSLRQFEQAPCLGWEWKAKNGEFGKVEHDAHRKANELMGRHQGLARAAQICRAAAIRHKATVTTDDLPEGGSGA